MPTIAHISDLHLQSGVPARQAQVEPVLQKINEVKPDLVVISGDVTDDGWDSIDELKWAKEWLDERIEPPQMVLPGNHDVGNFIGLEQGTIDSERIRRWCGVFTGSSLIILGGLNDWAVLGVNSMILGMGSKQEHQSLYSEFQTLYELDLTRLVVFMHSPLLINDRNETDNPETSYWLGDSKSRAELWDEVLAHRVKLIGSGHVHQTRLTEHDGIKIAWAPPASGTWVHAPGLPNPPMPERTGFFLHTLHDDGRVETELIACAPMLKLYEHRP